LRYELAQIFGKPAKHFLRCKGNKSLAPQKMFFLATNVYRYSGMTTRFAAGNHLANVLSRWVSSLNNDAI